MRVRIENQVQELHRQVARLLVDNFDVILLPTFETSEMLVRGRRRIRSKTVRNPLSLPRTTASGCSSDTRYTRPELLSSVSTKPTKQERSHERVRCLKTLAERP